MSDSQLYVTEAWEDMVTAQTATIARLQQLNSTADTLLVPGSAGAPSLPHAIIVGALLTSIAIAAIVGNTLVILSVLTNPKLRTITNRFVASLACADLAVGTLVMPLAVKVEVTGAWRLGRVLCDVWISFDVLLCTASILNLCAISIDRYISVTRPLQTFTGSWRSRRKANSMIASAWVLAVVITCPPLFGWREADRATSGDVCTLTQDPGYVIYSALGSFYVPLIVMLFVYGNIYNVTRHRLPADGRLRRTESEAGTHVTLTTPLTRSVKLQSPPMTTGINNPIQNPMVSANDSSTSSVSGKNDEILEQNINLVEMRSVDPEHPTSGQHEVRCFDAAVSGRAQTARSVSLITALKPGYSLRRSSTPTSSPSVRRTSTSLSRFTFVSSRPDWRRTISSPAGRTESRRENKAAKTLAIVVGGFVVCWLPFFVLYVIEPFCSSCHVSDALRSVLTWLGYANSLVNPFIYATYNRHFRQSFWSLTIGRLYHTSTRA